MPLGAADYTPTNVFFLDAATYVAAGAALFSMAAFVLASLARDVGFGPDPNKWFQRGAGHGSVFGFVLYLGLR